MIINNTKGISHEGNSASVYHDEEYFKKHISIEDTIHDYTKNSDKTQRETTIFVNRTKGSQTEIYPISIMEAAKVN